MQTATLPNHHRFTGAYKPIERESKQLGVCPCGCGEEVTDGYVYSIYEGMYFSDDLHVLQYLKRSGELVSVG